MTNQTQPKPVRAIIIPTFEEAANIAHIAKAVREAVANLTGITRLLVVDDSPTEQTVLEVQRAAEQYSTDKFIIEAIRRVNDERTGSLAGAVAYGLMHCKTEEFVAVMDGDGQHPTQMLGGMFAAAKHADVVMGSRYKNGGGNAGLSGKYRYLVSRSCVLSAKIMFPRALKEVSDPMSGFFVIRRSSFNLDLLRPTGFKILLELLSTHPGVSVIELPMQLGRRLGGVSKFSKKQVAHLYGQLFGIRMRQWRAN